MAFSRVATRQFLGENLLPASSPTGAGGSGTARGTGALVEGGVKLPRPTARSPPDSPGDGGVVLLRLTGLSPLGIGPEGRDYCLVARIPARHARTFQSPGGTITATRPPGRYRQNRQ
ncbi:hypothetical protein GCM10027160_54560 [Streptomyces calidiresistens]